MVVLKASMYLLTEVKKSLRQQILLLSPNRERDGEFYFVFCFKISKCLIRVYWLFIYANYAKHASKVKFDIISIINYSE